jgi:hypothetical protein
MEAAGLIRCHADGKAAVRFGGSWHGLPKMAPFGSGKGNCFGPSTLTALVRIRMVNHYV